ncbi:hypothetical protein D9M68_127710 [compost metagenome]
MYSPDGEIALRLRSQKPSPRAMVRDGTIAGLIAIGERAVWSAHLPYPQAWLAT